MVLVRTIVIILKLQCGSTTQCPSAPKDTPSSRTRLGTRHISLRRFFSHSGYPCNSESQPVAAGINLNLQASDLASFLRPPGDNPRRVKETLQRLEGEKKRISESPGLSMAQETKRFRQACFNASHKAKKGTNAVCRRQVLTSRGGGR